MMPSMLDRHAYNLLDKRLVFWVRRLSMARTRKEIARIEAKIDNIYAELDALQRGDSPHVGRTVFDFPYGVDRGRI